MESMTSWKTCARGAQVAAFGIAALTLTTRAQEPVPPPEARIVERGPHHRTWARVTEHPLRDGRVLYQTNSYDEIATGLHYFDFENGQWLDTQELIEPAEGGAVARRGPHKVRFAAQINTAGSITLTDPEGGVFRSHPLALYYMDATDGRYEMIAQVKDSTAVLVSDNELVYPDAFTGFKCDLRFRYTKNGFEQDVILRQSPPPPEQFGIRAETARLCVVTEFLDAPAPERRAQVLRRLPDAGGPALAEPDLIEETLDFGLIKAYQGSAFPLGAEGDENEPVAQTGKTWETWEGRTVLVERTDYEQIKSHVERLPKSAALKIERRDGALQARAAGTTPRRFPAAPAVASPVLSAPVLRLALNDFKQPGFVLDYQMVTTITGMVFRGDTTYYVSNANVTLSGTTTIEGGTVVKFSKHPNNSHRLYLVGTVDCRTDSHRPAFFVGQDDDTVGELINGSTGSPGTNRYANRALDFGPPGKAHQLANIHIRNAAKGFTPSATSTDLTVSHAQLGFTDFAFYNNGSNIVARNVLIHDSLNGFYGGGKLTNRAEHVTLHRVGTLANTTTFLTNSLLISVTNNLAYLSGSNNATNLSDSGIFQTVGAGARYLTAGSTNRNAGTTNINAALLAELKQRTTYPPVVLSNFTLTTNLTLAPQAARDTDLPDRGYHYDGLDYVLHQVAAAYVTLTVLPGTAIGVFGDSADYGLQVGEGMVVQAKGTASDPCRFTRYNCVQEQATTNWSASSAGFSIYAPASAYTNVFRFTEWTMPAGGTHHFSDGLSGATTDSMQVHWRDSALHGGGVWAIKTVTTLTNCVFNRCGLFVYSLASEIRNGLFIGGSFLVDGNFGSHNVSDTFFDRTFMDTNGWFGTTNHHNGYITGQDRLVPEGTNNLTITNLSYVTGPLGRFYQPTNSPLIQMGGMTADLSGLYHHTVATNQVKETNSIVDLGFHYVAIHSNGTFPDYDFDGVADYLEDFNGNGAGDIGETLWLHSDTDYDGRSDGDEPVDGTNPLDAGSVKLVRLGHWRFDDVTLAGDEGQLPADTYNVVPPVASWSSNALYVQTNSQILYREIETNGRPNINLRSGTVRFWFKPDWSSATAGGSGPQNYARLIEVGTYSGDATIGWWGLGFDLGGDTLSFTSHSNGVYRPYWDAPVSLVSNRWHQFTLSYSPSNTALFLNGQMLYNDAIARANDRPVLYATKEKLNTSGGGIYNYPAASIRANGFRVGNSGYYEQAKGQFEELETFNYPLTPQQIAAGFPGFYGATGASGVTNDFDYDGRSDLLEYQADGTLTNDASSVLGGRLGYWRFNAATNALLGEAMQAPLVVSGVSVTPGWSSNALVVSSASSSAVVYRDMETNGWANFNCRYGAVRFWFRPGYGAGGPGTDAPFLYMGSAASANNGQWELGVASNGKSVKFITASNSAPSILMTANVDLTSNRWHHVAFNYGTNNLALYVNGALITNLASGLSLYPAPAYRLEGLAIGNSTARARSLNSQFDELETFNRQLTAAEIWRSFESFRAMDHDLNGVPDLLEDVSLAVSSPFVGFPFAITGTLEAEQFDKGGKGIAYTNVANNWWTNDYRASQIEVTNANDLGGGYCVNNLRADEWLNYTIDVRVGQTYAIEPRVAAIGTNVGGVFRFDFYTNGSATPYTNTGPLVITSTNWQDVTYRMVRLAQGTNVMRLVLLTNAPGTTAVGRFNYLSVYPAWNEWWPTNGMTTNTVTGLMATNSTTNIWREATNNAAQIQAAIDTLPGAGVVRIPEGSFYVAQKVVDERMSSETNAAIYVTQDNVAIQGAGQTNTVLIGHNRATTVLNIGYVPKANGSVDFEQKTNFVFRDLTVEGRPHWVAVTNISTEATKPAFTNFWEQGGLYPHDLGGDPGPLGSLIVCTGPVPFTTFNHTLVFTNCLFRNAANDSLWFRSWTSNILIRGCTFLFRDGTNGTYPSPRSTTTVSLTTSNTPLGGVGVFSDAGQVRNIVVLDNVYNGNPGMTSVNTNELYDAGDGIVYLQGGGNWFVARNRVTNYGLEGAQMNSGPASGAGNIFDTQVTGASTTAYVMAWTGWWGAMGVLGRNPDHSFSMVGNSIRGGRYGNLGHNHYNTSVTPQRVHFTGNTVELFPAINAFVDHDYPSAASREYWAEFLNVSGNTLVAGGHGVVWVNNGTNALILKNDFGAASYRALSFTSTNTGVLNITAARNILNQGSASHVRPRVEDAPGWFLLRNTYRMNGSTNSINPFIEPSGSPVHFVH